MKQQLVDKFQQIYGDGAVTGIYFAPGRVNLIGEHTDFPVRSPWEPMHL